MGKRTCCSSFSSLGPAEALRKTASLLAARAAGEHASCALEKATLEMSAKPVLPKALRHRLWAQVVEIQKRLDVYDPAVPEEGDDVGRVGNSRPLAGAAASPAILWQRRPNRRRIAVQHIKILAWRVDVHRAGC